MENGTVQYVLWAGEDLGPGIRGLQPGSSPKKMRWPDRPIKILCPLRPRRPVICNIRLPKLPAVSSPRENPSSSAVRPLEVAARFSPSRSSYSIVPLANRHWRSFRLLDCSRFSPSTGSSERGRLRKFRIFASCASVSSRLMFTLRRLPGRHMVKLHRLAWPSMPDSTF